MNWSCKLTLWQRVRDGGGGQPPVKSEVIVFPILLFSSISLHWLLRKAFLSLLAIFWNSAFRCLYLSFSPLLFTSLLFTAIRKGSPDSHFAFLHFFSMGMVLIPVSCTMSQTSIHSLSGILSIRFSPLNVFLTSTVLIHHQLLFIVFMFHNINCWLPVNDKF